MNKPLMIKIWIVLGIGFSLSLFQNCTSAKLNLANANNIKSTSNKVTLIQSN